MRTGTEPQIQSARPTQFMEAIDRLKAEHESLQSDLMRIRKKGETVSRAQSGPSVRAKLIELRTEMDALMAQLNTHAQWEEQELFPMLVSYFNKVMAPSILPSIWVMEKDHELAEIFVASFVERVEAAAVTEGPEVVKEAVSHLVQACLILTEHLTLEEEVVYPMAEQILTDIDSLFS